MLIISTLYCSQNFDKSSFNIALGMEVYKDLRILGGVTWIITFLIGCLGNLYVLSTIRTILRQRKNIPNLLVLILSVSDLVCVFCTYIIPGISYITGKYMGGNLVCTLQTFIVIFVNTLSILIFVGIVLERYYAVADPYSYQQHIMYNSKKIFVFLLLCIFLSACVSIPSIVKSKNILQFPGTFCMIDTNNLSNLRIRINVIFYTIVLCIFVFSIVFGNTLSVYTIRKMTSFRRQHTTNRDGNSEEYLFIRLCIVTCSLFLVLWIPLLVYFISTMANFDTPNWFSMLAFRLAALNCVINPWLYPLLRTRFRNALNWHIGIILHYATFTLLQSPAQTLTEVVSNEGKQAVRQDVQQGDEEHENIMINIAQRNIIDYVDAPPPEDSKSHESESYDVKMQSVSNDHEILENSKLDQTD